MTLDKEKIKRVEQLVDEAAEEYDEFPQEICDELQNEFTEWKCDERRLSKSNNTSFYSTKNDRYGYEKIIDINAGYESKFIIITLKNMDDDEKNRFISIINKWAGAIVQV